MTDRTTSTQREVYAPQGKAWIDGYDTFPGCWDRVEDARSEEDQTRVRYAQQDGTDSIVRVPADEPASQADLMALAATVDRMATPTPADLERENAALRAEVARLETSLRIAQSVAEEALRPPASGGAPNEPR